MTIRSMESMDSMKESGATGPSDLIEDGKRQCPVESEPLPPTHSKENKEIKENKKDHPSTCEPISSSSSFSPSSSPSSSSMTPRCFQCRKKSLLEFKCKFCKQNFCLSHRLYETHHCPQTKDSSVFGKVSLPEAIVFSKIEKI